MKYHVTALVIGSTYVGEIEADSPEDLKAKLKAKEEELKGKWIRPEDLDDDRLDFEEIDQATKHDGIEYVPAKWRPA